MHGRSTRRRERSLDCIQRGHVPRRHCERILRVRNRTECMLYFTVPPQLFALYSYRTLLARPALYDLYITQTSPATTKHPTTIVTTTGTAFHLTNSRRETCRPFWARMSRHSKPASEAGNLSADTGSALHLRPNEPRRSVALWRRR